MESLRTFFDLLAKSDPDYVGMDTCHYLQIIGTLIAKKPENVLEVGIGTALMTAGLVMGLRYNQRGRLTCVDNWFDWQGIEPPGVTSLRSSGVTVVAPVDERVFLEACPDDTYDFVVSDGDHRNIWLWIDHYFRVTRPDGIIYFHDSNNTELFPTIGHIEQRVKQLGLPYYHFKQNSRPDERCDRGLLMVVNSKVSLPCNTDLGGA